MKRAAFRAVYAPTWQLLLGRRWLAHRINNGGALAELACYIPWLVTSGLGRAGLRVATVLV